MEKLLGRRAVSCLGYLLILFVLLLAAALLWPRSHHPADQSGQEARPAPPRR